MWRFYWRAARRIPSLAVEAVTRLDKFSGWLTICVWLLIGGSAAGAWWQDLPWWVPAAALVVFLVYGFLRAVYEESRREAANVALDASRLRDYERRDKSNEADRECNEGFANFPVSTVPTVGVALLDEEGFADARVPYKPAPPGDSNPARTTVSVGTLGATYYIALGYLVYGTQGPFNSGGPVETRTRLDVLECSGDEERLFKRLLVYSGEATVAENGSWWCNVSCAITLSNLPEGVYGFEVHDLSNGPGQNRVFKNMHLVVSEPSKE